MIRKNDKMNSGKELICNNLGADGMPFWISPLSMSSGQDL